MIFSLNIYSKKAKELLEEAKHRVEELIESENK